MACVLYHVMIGGYCHSGMHKIICNGQIIVYRLQRKIQFKYACTGKTVCLPVQVLDFDSEHLSRYPSRNLFSTDFCLNPYCKQLACVTFDRVFQFSISTTHYSTDIVQLIAKIPDIHMATEPHLLNKYMTQVSHFLYTESRFIHQLLGVYPRRTAQRSEAGP